MITTPSDTLLLKFSKFLSDQMGLYYTRDRWPDLIRGIASASPAFGFNNVESCMEWLMSSQLRKSQVEVLASHLTIGETYFFRDKKLFDALEKNIFPQIISDRGGQLKIWSAGCSTGEEPYSIAMLLRKMVSPLNKNDLSIIGTDINPVSLQKALEGVYSNWSFRDTPIWVKDRYFVEKCGKFEISTDIKKMVKFSFLNLIKDTFPSLSNDTVDLDVIFCRNVLMYFQQDYRKSILERFYYCLNDGGYLIVSPSEGHLVPLSQFSAIHLPGAILYQKGPLAPKKNVHIVIDTFVSKNPDTVFQFDLTSQENSFEELFNLKDYDYLEQASGYYPKEKEPQQSSYEKAQELYEKGLYGEVVSILAGLLTDVSQEDQEQGITLLARAYANQGNVLAAEECCKKAISCNKLNPSLHFLLATILQEQGQLEEAMSSLARALYLDQNFVLAHFTMANIKRQLGNFKEVDKYLQNTLTLLKNHQQDELLPESQGITAGRLSEIVQSMIAGGIK